MKNCIPKAGLRFISLNQLFVLLFLSILYNQQNANGVLVTLRRDGCKWYTPNNSAFFDFTSVNASSNYYVEYKFSFFADTEYREGYAFFAFCQYAPNDYVHTTDNNQCATNKDRALSTASDFNGYGNSWCGLTSTPNDLNNITIALDDQTMRLIVHYGSNYSNSFKYQNNQYYRFQLVISCNPSTTQSNVAGKYASNVINNITFESNAACPNLIPVHTTVINAYTPMPQAYYSGLRYSMAGIYLAGQISLLVLTHSPTFLCSLSFYAAGITGISQILMAVVHILPLQEGVPYLIYLITSTFQQVELPAALFALAFQLNSSIQGGDLHSFDFFSSIVQIGLSLLISLIDVSINNVKYQTDTVAYALGSSLIFIGMQTFEKGLKGTSGYHDLTGLIGLGIGSVSMTILYFLVAIIADFGKYQEFM